MIIWPKISDDDPSQGLQTVMISLSGEDPADGGFQLETDEAGQEMSAWCERNSNRTRKLTVTRTGD